MHLHRIGNRLLTLVPSKAARVGATDGGARSPAPAERRDFRIDFFRGLALIMIFIDHSPGNGLSNLTLRRMGFSDAAEIFVLLSGISAAMAYRGTFANAGWLVGVLRIAGRCGRIYVAHLMTLLAVAVIAMVMLDELGDPEFLDRLNLAPLFSETEKALVAALTLRYLPHYLDILPLYICLLALVPFVLGAAQRHHLRLLAASVAVYAIARMEGWNLPRYAPGEVWYFNPFGWQLLFVIGLVLGSLSPGKRVFLERRPAVVRAALAFIAFAFVAAAPWRVLPGLEDLSLLPASWHPDPSKTDLSPWRLVNVLAQACVAAYFIPRSSPMSHTWPVQQVRRCGAHALEIYCLGTVLSLLAFCAFTVVGTDIGPQIAINAAGVAVMLAAAALIAWYRSKPWQLRSRPAAAPS